jgi:hypothetical protein
MARQRPIAKGAPSNLGTEVLRQLLRATLARGSVRTRISSTAYIFSVDAIPLV